MDLSPDYLLIIFSILIALFLISIEIKMFDIKGALGAVIIGAFVSILASIQWLILLIVFAAVSHIATIYRIKDKKKSGLQEGKKGERGISNVFYGGLIGVFISIFTLSNLNVNYFAIFSATFAAITSDTLASEIGVLDKKTYLITTLKPVTTGTNGGISFLGEIASLLGAISISISYLILTNFSDIFPAFVILIAGFLSCQLDSILGAIYENRKKMNKGQVNLFSQLFSAILSFLILSL
ncbi:DUF92 domain-containing protein [Caldiplasma sukawensis]